MDMACIRLALARRRASARNKIPHLPVGVYRPTHVNLFRLARGMIFFENVLEFAGETFGLPRRASSAATA
jgi:hypothetical protein